MGSLNISIPWTQLSDKPTQVEIDELYVLVGPAAEFKESAEEALARKRRDKQKKLEAAEEKRHKDTQKSSDAENTFAAKLAEKIVANLQIAIRNVHVRYEDVSTDPLRPFAFGVTISELTALTTDAAWKPAFVSADMKILNKLAQLRHLSVYWNTLAGAPFKWDDAESGKLFMRSLIPSVRVPIISHDYILKPVDAELKLTINRTSGVSKITADVEIEEVALGLLDAQYRNALALLTLLTCHFTRLDAKLHEGRYVTSRLSLPFRLVRPPFKLAVSYPSMCVCLYSPAVPVQASPRAWWQYAIRSTLEDVRARRARWSLQAIHLHQQRRKQYLKLYRAKLKDSKFSGAEKKELEQLEDDLDFEDIVFFRSLTERNLAERRMIKEAEKARFAARFKSLFTGASTRTDDSITLSADEMQKLSAIIDFDPSAADSGTAIASVLELRFLLRHGEFTLAGASRDAKIVTLGFDDAGATVCGQVGSTLTVACALRSLHIDDQATPHTLLPTIVRPLSASAAAAAGAPAPKLTPAAAAVDQSALWRMELQLPGDATGTTTMRMWLRPLQIVYAKRCLERCISFFYLADNSMVQTLEGAARSHLQRLTSRSRAQLQDALQSHKRMALMMDLQAPQIVLPADPADPRARALVLNLGQFHMQTTSAGATPAITGATATATTVGMAASAAAAAGAGPAPVEPATPTHVRQKSVTPSPSKPALPPKPISTPTGILTACLFPYLTFLNCCPCRRRGESFVVACAQVGADAGGPCQ